MKRIKIGILTMSDGREYLHEEYEEMNLRYQRDIAAALEATGDFEVVQGQCAIHTNAEARAEGQRLRDANVEATIFNFAIWCYPQFTAVAQNFAPGPYLLFSNLHPSECGMVGMLAAAGTLDQLGVKYTRLWGTVSDPAVFQRMTAFLRGLTFGNFGGRPLGMYTAVANLEQWQREFRHRRGKRGAGRHHPDRRGGARRAGGSRLPVAGSPCGRNRLRRRGTDAG